LPGNCDSKLKELLIVMVTVQYMWIDDTSADVIKVDFEALYHGDFLVEGDCSEQFPDLAQAV
jgi:hypothetical protein